MSYLAIVPPSFADTVERLRAELQAGHSKVAEDTRPQCPHCKARLDDCGVGTRTNRRILLHPMGNCPLRWDTFQP